MNKTTFHRKLWVLLVISFTTPILLIFSSFVFIENNDEDYILLNKILERTKIKNPDKTIVLNEENNNDFVISIINQLNTIEESKNEIKLDSLKNEIGIKNNVKFNSIFNLREYSILKSQKSSSKWSFDKVIGATNYSDVKGQLKLYVSKPIYTRNLNFALIYISNGKTSYIVIFEKTKKEWNEYKIISPMIVNAKVSLKK